PRQVPRPSRASVSRRPEAVATAMPGRGGSPACGQTHLVLVLPWRTPYVAERVGYSPPRKGGAREALTWPSPSRSKGVTATEVASSGPCGRHPAVGCGCLYQRYSVDKDQLGK